MTTNGSPRPAPEDTGALLAKAAWWRLAGLLLERPRAGWHAEVERLGDEVEDPSLRRLAARARSAAEGSYLALLGPGGAVSPRAVAYRGLEDPGRSLAALNGLYRAFAFHPRREDPPDHAAVMCGFAGYLALKEAFARAEGLASPAARARRGREVFLREHLAPVARGLHTALAAAGADGVQAGAAQQIARRTHLLLADVTFRLPAAPAAGGGPAAADDGDRDGDGAGGCAGAA